MEIMTSRHMALCLVLHTLNMRLSFSGHDIQGVNKHALYIVVHDYTCMYTWGIGTGICIVLCICTRQISEGCDSEHLVILSTP